MIEGYRVKLQILVRQNMVEAGGWGGSQSDYSVCPLLLMLEVDFMLHVSQVYKDVELDNNIQLSNHCPVQSVQTDQRNITSRRRNIMEP